jgi:hypothetical protein
MIPATISNNVPGTEFSLGCDTALNEITEVSITIYKEEKEICLNLRNKLYDVVFLLDL